MNDRLYRRYCCANSALNPLLTDNGTMYRQIFSMNPDSSEFTMLHTYEATGNSSPYMQYADGYLYFEQGFYNDAYNPSDGYTGSDEQSAHIMRIPVKSGKAETVIADELNIGSFDPEDTITIICAIESGIWASVSNGRSGYEDGASFYSCLIQYKDGKLLLDRIYK